MSQTQSNIAASKSVVPDAHKVSLVELIIILLLVGLVFVFVFGMSQLKIDKAAEALAQQKFEAIIPALQRVIAAAEDFKKKDEFGDYPFDYSQLNLGDLSTEDFTIEYDNEIYAVRAITKAAFGKEGIRVTYILTDASYQVEDPAPERKPTIRDEWLPQD
jgi:hypothetical protein